MGDRVTDLFVRSRIRDAAINAVISPVLLFSLLVFSLIKITSISVYSCLHAAVMILLHSLCISFL